LAVHGARREERSNVYRYLVGNPERKKSLRRIRNKWRDNIKTKPKVM
jgi:hypothetical protein